VSSAASPLPVAVRLGVAQLSLPVLRGSPNAFAGAPCGLLMTAFCNRKGLVKAIQQGVARGGNRTHLRRAGTVQRREANLRLPPGRGVAAPPRPLVRLGALCRFGRRSSGLGARGTDGAAAYLPNRVPPDIER